MSDELRAAHRQRARLLGRVGMTFGIAPVLFLLLSSFGVPGFPDIGFGGGAQADRGIVVRIAATPHTRGGATVAPVSNTAAHRPPKHHSIPVAASPARDRAPVTTANLPPARSPGTTPKIGPQAPTPAQPAPASPASGDVPQGATLPPVVVPALPALPPLPPVQVPVVAVPIPPVLPPQPVVPALPIPPPLNPLGP